MLLKCRGRPDFVEAGNFTGQGHVDLVTAARGENTIFVFSGDGQGHFSSPQAIALPGAVTALGAGSFGPHSHFTSLVIGVKAGGKTSAILFRGSPAGLSMKGSFALGAPATQVAFGDLNGDSLPDAAILAGGNLLMLYSSSGAAKPRLETASLPVSATSLALGRFVFDRDPRMQVALLDKDGSIHIAAHGGLDSRTWTSDEVKRAVAQRGRASLLPAASSSGKEVWNVVETFAGAAPFSVPSRPPVLLRARISSRGADDVMALNGETGQMVVISHPNRNTAAASFARGEQSVASFAGRPVAALSMRVNVDARPGLIVLQEGQLTPSISMPLPDPTFTVNTTADTVDANPGDGICADAQGLCSLRAAVMEANAITGNDTIMVPAGTFTLQIPNNGLYNASGGHLDINDGLTIVGAGQNSTIIQAGTTSTNGIDKVFSIAAPALSGALGPSFATSLSNMTIQFGMNTDINDPFGGAFDWDAGANGTGTISITSCTIQNNSAVSTQATFNDGGGAFFSNEAGFTGTVTISSSTIQGNTAQDGGGGIFIGQLVPLTVSNTQILSNKALGGGAQQGGGLAIFGPSGASQSAIHNSTISGNQAGSQGGGIYATAGLLIDQGTVITGNTSSQTGGGLWTAPTNETTTITTATITSNSAPGGGGGIQVDSSVGNTLNMTFSRVVGNTPNGINNISGTVTATDVWWGCNGGPNATGCDSVTGTATTSPWLKLTGSPNPSTIIVGNSTLVTASMLLDSQNNVIAAGNLTALAQIPVSWTNPVDCTVSNAQPNIASGAATANCTGTVAGAGQLTATVDHASVTASFPVTDFTVSISPTSQKAVVNGGSATYTVAVTPVNGFCGGVSLNTIGFAVRGKPNLVNTTFTPPSVTISCAAPAQVTSQMTVTTVSTTPVTSIPFTVTGSSGTPLQTRSSAQATLVVTDFSVSLTPAGQQLVVGGSVNYTLTVSPINGFIGTVNLTSCGISPAGVGVTLTGCPGSLTINAGPVPAALTVSASLSAPLQTYTISVTGIAAATSDAHSTSATATTTDFTVAVTTSTPTVISGQNGTFNATVSPLNGFTGTVNISCSFSPAGPTISGCPAPVSITTGPVSFTITAGTAGIALQTYTLSVKGTSTVVTSNVHTATASMSVQPLILRPISFTTFGSTAGYSNPVNAMDGNSGTFSSGPTVATGALNEIIWGTFPAVSGTPTQILLKATSAANCTGANDGVELDYSLDNGNTNQLFYILGLFAAFPPPPAVRPLQTDVISLPVTQNTANVTVLAMVSSTVAGCHQVYDTWMEVKF